MKLLPNESDFLLAHCTEPGLHTAKSDENGSLFIQKLTKLLKKYGSKSVVSLYSVVLSVSFLFLFM